MEPVSDGQAFTARLPFAGRHRFVGDEQVVKPARTRQADLVSGVEDACRGAQKFARAVKRKCLQKSFWRQSAPATKQVMQVGRGYAGRMSDRVDLRLGSPVPANMRDRAAHNVVVRGRSRKRRELGETIGQG